MVLNLRAADNVDKSSICRLLRVSPLDNDMCATFRRTTNLFRIIGTGWIATKSAENLSKPSDDFADVLHSIAAVGSNDKNRATEFIERVCPKGAVSRPTNGPGESRDARGLWILR
jgi:hypothetical protein